MANVNYSTFFDEVLPEVAEAEKAQRLIKPGNCEPADQKASKPNDDTAMVITNGDEQIDLAVTGHAELLEIARDMGLELRSNVSAKNLREAIFARANNQAD